MYFLQYVSYCQIVYKDYAAWSYLLGYFYSVLWYFSNVRNIDCVFEALNSILFKSRLPCISPFFFWITAEQVNLDCPQRILLSQIWHMFSQPMLHATISIFVRLC
jgi:hypothetical protein